MSRPVYDRATTIVEAERLLSNAINDDTGYEPDSAVIEAIQQEAICSIAASLFALTDRRTLFAGLAMQALLASPIGSEEADAERWGVPTRGPDYVAKRAVGYADALIAALDKKTEGEDCGSNT